MKRRLSRSLVRRAYLPWIGGHFGSLLLAFIALFSLTVSVLNPNSISGLRSGVADVFAPVLYAVSKPVQDAAMFVRNVSGLAELQAENIRLEQENIRLREWYQTALVLQAENQSLRNLLNVKLEPRTDYVTARILADSGRSFVKSFLVSAGARDNVSVGQPVISGEGLVGRVIEAGKATSRILLVTDINSRVPILVENSSQHAVLAGNNNDFPHLVHLPPGTRIEDGARIITSGQGGIFPKGLPVGRVINDKSGKPYVELFADFDRMVYVRVVNVNKEPDFVRLDTN